MLYASIDDLLKYLPQLPTDSHTVDKMVSVLQRASDIVSGALGFKFDSYGEERAMLLRAGSGILWRVPFHEKGSLSRIVRHSDDAEITDYFFSDYSNEIDSHCWLYRQAGWRGELYHVFARWGYGEPPPVITQVTLEVAVNILRQSDRGMFTDVVGVAGGGEITPARPLTSTQLAILRDVRRLYLGVVFD